VPLDACVEVELDGFFGCYFLRVPFRWPLVSLVL
jgi:hypothetical protein